MINLKERHYLEYNVINAWMHPYVGAWIMFLDFVCFYLSKLLLPSLQYLLVNAEMNYSPTVKKKKKKELSCL